MILTILKSFGLTSITRRDFWAAENWLRQMGQGANINNINIKYCMALPREILSSVQIESVNAARVSGDYRLSRDNWRIGISTHLATALGLAAFKDTFWSSPVNTEHPFYYDCMIGEDEQDPNVPWTISYRYDGPRSKTRKLSFLFVLSPITYVLTSLQYLVKTAFLGMTWTFITPLQTTILNGMPVELLGDFHIWVAKANLGASPMLAFK